MNKSEKILSVNDLSVGFAGRKGSRELLLNINSDVEKGELIAMVGANGVGKSTMLRTIVGLHPRLAGNISLINRELGDYSRQDIARKAAFVTAGSTVSQNLTVYELVSLGRFPHTNWIGQLKDIDKEHINSSIEDVGLSGKMDIRIDQLSDGEKQRAMIARAVAQDTELLVLDEPTAFLDLPNKYELIHLLRRLAETNNKSIIFSTHDLHIALKESDKIWLLIKSQLIQGAPEDLILNGSVKEIFTNSQLEFSEEEGNFYLPAEAKFYLRLRSSDNLKNATRQALERINVKITEDKRDPLLEADFTSSGPGWTLYSDDSDRSFDSIYNLCRFLKSIQD